MKNIFAASETCASVCPTYPCDVNRRTLVETSTDLAARSAKASSVFPRTKCPEVVEERTLTSDDGCDVFEQELCVWLNTGMRMAVKRWYPADGLPNEPKDQFIALHGWHDNCAVYNGLGPRMARAGAVFVAPDLIGTGHSSHPAFGLNPSPVENMVSLLDCANQLEMPRFHIMGHGLSSYIAILLAAAFPERVCSIASVDSLGMPSMHNANISSMFRHDCIASMACCLRHQDPRAPLGVFIPSRTFASVEEIATCVQKERHKGDMSWEAAMDIARREASEAPYHLVPKHSKDKRYILSRSPMMRSPRMWISEYDMCKCMAELCCPFLLILPECGWPIDRHFFEARVGGVQRKRVVRLENTGHNVHADRPDLVSDVLVEWLAAFETTSLRCNLETIVSRI